MVESIMSKKPNQPALRIAYGSPSTPAPINVVAIVTAACFHDGPAAGTVSSTWRTRWNFSTWSWSPVLV